MKLKALGRVKASQTEVQRQCTLSQRCDACGRKVGSMTRINFLLLAAVVATMLYIVKVQYESRQLFVAIEKATVDVRKLELEHAVATSG